MALLPDSLSRGGQVPDRPPGRHRRGAVHHLPGVPAGDGRARCPATPATTRTSNATLTNEFATVGYRAHSQIHGEFEIEADAGPLHRGHSWPRFEAAGRRGRAERRRRRRPRHPAERGVLQPGPARGGAARPDAAGARRRVAVQQRRDDRQPAAQRAVPGAGAGQPDLPRRPDPAGLLHRRERPRRDRHPARPRPRHPHLQPAAPGVRAAAEDLVHRDHRRGDRRVPGRPAADPGNEINDPNILDVTRALPTSTATPIDPVADAADGADLAACAAPPWPPGSRRSTATSTRSTRSSA